MRPTSIALSTIGVSLGVVGIATSTLVLSLLGFVIMLAAGLQMTIAKTRSNADSEVGVDLSPEGQTLLRPLRKLAQELEQVRTKGEGTSPFLAEEAVQEARRLLQESAATLSLRDKLVREVRGEYEASKSVQSLAESLKSAGSDDERASLEGALGAREQELTHYTELKSTIAAIESSVRQAEAALAEMKARMASGNAGALATQTDDQLRDAIGRMKALSTTLNETQDLGQL